MKTLFFECAMGAAGDMMMAALLELIPDSKAFIQKLNALDLPGVNVSVQPSIKCGISGTHVTVSVSGREEESLDATHEHEHAHPHDHPHSHGHGNHGHGHRPNHPHNHTDAAHHHVGIAQIEHIVSHLNLPGKVQADVLAVYRLIAEAESHAHQKPVDQVHFHEVGMMDAVADIVGVCLLLDIIAPDQILASPVHVGSGQVRCAHGLLPVPAPATAHILQGIPTYGGSIQGELCTPTGAALLKHFVSSFGDQPVMKVGQIGYGMGKKDFAAANCLRAFLGETEKDEDRIVELCCNLDDMTPEAIGFAQERLFTAGALDVYTTAIGMKKSRPGILLSCLVPIKKRDLLIRQLFRHTTTLGIREFPCRRFTLQRSEQVKETDDGPIRIKQSNGWDVCREKIEYEDAARIARKQDISLSEALNRIKREK